LEICAHYRTLMDRSVWGKPNFHVVFLGRRAKTPSSTEEGKEEARRGEKESEEQRRIQSAATREKVEK
jgi:hypothetical protein